MKTVFASAPATWKIDAIAAAIMVAVTAGSLIGLQPVLSRSADESRAVSMLVGERRATSELSRSLAQKQSEFRTVKRTLENFSQTFWTDTDKTRRMGAVYTVAREAGVKPDVLEPGSPEMTAGRRVVPLKLMGRGSYLAVAQMFTNIRAAAPDMVVRSVELSPLPNSDEEVQLATEILWVLPAETPGATAAAK